MHTYLTDGVVPSCWQVSDLECQIWGISTKLGGLAGEHLGKGSTCYALLVLIHALVKQKPAHNCNIACLTESLYCKDPLLGAVAAQCIQFQQWLMSHWTTSNIGLLYTAAGVKWAHFKSATE